MIMASSRHEAAIDARVRLSPKPFDLGTIIGSVASAPLARWAQDNELPAQLRNWSAADTDG
jgi:hypothetical protein